MKTIISWFARNHVASNLLMLFLILAGILTAFSIKLEVFPESSLDKIIVRAIYPGASPEEIEESIVTKIEEKVGGLSGVKEIDSAIREGHGSVTVEIIEGWDIQSMLDEVKSEVDAIDTFPVDMEQPVIKELIRRAQVINVAIYGEASEAVLKKLAEDARDDIVTLPGVTTADLKAIREEEIHVEISEKELRKYNLTLKLVADIIRKESLDLPAGKIKTQNLEILIRTKGRKYMAKDYRNIVILKKNDGSQVKLGDIASIKEGFQDVDYAFKFEGNPASMIQVMSVADQNALQIAAEVKKYVEANRLKMPAGVDMKVFGDMSRILKGRMNLLLKNMLMGLALVACILGIFMSFRLSFWVTLGIPISFMFGLSLLPQADVSINMISLFGFIMILGIVVDDAIIIGENIFKKREEGMGAAEAAFKGALEVAPPVIFSVLTTMAAFWPLMTVGGVMGKMMRNIPIVVILVLIGSLVESLLILPSHLSAKGSHSSAKKEKFSSVWLKKFINGPYAKMLKFCLRWRYSALAFGCLLLLATLGTFAGGFIKFTFFPKVEGDSINCYITMPAGTSVEKTDVMINRLESHALETIQQLERERPEESDGILKYNMSLRGFHTGRMARVADTGGHLGQIWIQLTDGDNRRTTATEITRAWRKKIGTIPEAESITFGNELHSGGVPIEIHLSMHNQESLLAAKDELKKKIAQYNGTFDIADNLLAGKKEMQLRLKPAAHSLGITLSELATQVRNAFWGAEALSFQRGQNEIKVMVRYPENERESLLNIEEMRIRTKDNQEIPFSSIARVQIKDAYLTLERSQQRRVIKITADVDEAAANANEIRNDLIKKYLPELQKQFPGLRYALGGEGKNQAESMRDLQKGLIIALFCIYALLAIPFKSFAQPLVIMAAIPFGFVGAIGGHLIMGCDLSILSIFGMVGLTGVVVNDSLVLIDRTNKKIRNEGLSVYEALTEAAPQRFRAIILTSFTTFAGLFPIIMEKSVQAQFLIPMAISLAFGVIFATFVTLLFIPCAYMTLYDIIGLFKRKNPSRASNDPRPAEI